MSLIKYEYLTGHYNWTITCLSDRYSKQHVADVKPFLFTQCTEIHQHDIVSIILHTKVLATQNNKEIVNFIVVIVVCPLIHKR